MMYPFTNRSSMYARLFILLAILFGFGLHPTSELWAQPHPPTPIAFSAQQLLKFAEQLMREGEFFRAITEYRRFLFTYPASPQQAFVHFRLGIALYRGQRYEEALSTFRDLAQRYPDSPYAKQALLWQGESLMRQSQYTAAEQTYREISRTAQSEKTRQHAYYQLGWSLLYQRQWHHASSQFQRVTSESNLYQAAQRLATEVKKGQELPRKSPWTAGILSGLLPGSGQLYNGRAGDALLAFFLNALFVAGIVETINQNELAIAGVLSFFEAGWYAGNLYSAINGAHKHNRHATETFIRNLENQFRVLPPQARSPVGLRLNFSF